MNPLKAFILVLLKSLNPKYYMDLLDKDFSKSIKYFCSLLLFSFLLMAFLAVPSLLIIKSNMDKQVLDISKLKISADFETAEPIHIPENSPIITLDTSGSETLDEEAFLITDKYILYNLLGRKGEIGSTEFDFTKDRENFKNKLLIVLLAFLPSIFFFYYIAYGLKYLLILLMVSFLGYAFSHTTKNKLRFTDSLKLSFYTCTWMVLIEILSIPFFVKSYLLAYTPLIGLHFSVLAITAYLTVYVTSVRMYTRR
ncbi:DUF1189 domain-containing protein [Candidatus Woesearchaeota archaeon]|nr:DUF1189 domain-containing protein [Candidatus Woesearchaeota archaeon]